MLEFIKLSAFIVPLAPLLAALWIGFSFMVGWNRGEAGEVTTRRAALIAISSALLILMFLSVLHLSGIPLHTADGGMWLRSQNLNIRFNLLLDGLSLSVATSLTLVLWLVTRFSVTYLHREAAFQRFFMILMLFSGAMQLIWLSGNAVLTFIGWELAGVSSYLLIAYNWQRPSSILNAQRAFITNRIGDAGFILALFVALQLLHGLNWETMADQAQYNDITSLQLALLTFGLVIAAAAKSAQLPFSAWISHALEGPTPSSAVFYGSVMVHAGVYLLLRSAPLLELTPTLNYLIGLMGVMTVLYAWLIAQVQADVKSALIFATLMQVGLMFIEIALGWYTLALWHLILHAWWRAYQFLHAPAFMQLTHYPARSVSPWLLKRSGLLNAALQRFWLDSFSHALLVKPTQALARDAQVLEDHVIDRITGKSFLHHALTAEPRLYAGIPGNMLASAARIAQSIEHYLTSELGNSSAMKPLVVLERYLEIIERLLRQPHYLVVLIAVSLVIVL